MPKLLQINECLNFSTGNIAQGCVDAAIKQGWECYFAFSAFEPLYPSNAKLIKVGNKWNAYLHYAENYIFDKEGLASRMVTRRFIDEIKKITPGVVHIHNMHDHWLNYKLLFEYFNDTNIKVVWTFHDSWAFTGHCFHFVTKNCEKWKTGCYKCPLQREYPCTLVDRSKKNYELKKRLFDGNPNLTIVACSDWMASLVKQSFLKDKRIEVIHNGIDLNVFEPCGIKPSDGIFRVLAISNVWNKEKGYYDILRLRQLLPDSYEIIVVGLTAEQLKDLPQGIKGIQRTHNVQELVTLYSSANVLINPTYADTFPTINLEALACGTPVITYNTGGSPEAIDEKTGVVVNQGDVDELAKVICELKKHPLDKNACRERAARLFDKNKCFESYTNLYKELMELE